MRPGLGTIAVRDFHISLTGGPTALVGGTDFDLTALTLKITGGTLDYNVPAGFRWSVPQDLTGTTASPTSGTGTLIGSSSRSPMSVTTSFEVSSGVFATVNLVSAVVAVVPEPGTIAMLGLV